MDSTTPWYNNSTPDSYKNQSDQYGVIIIPLFLAVTTVAVIFTILWKTCRRKREPDRAPFVGLEASPTGQNEYIATVAESILSMRDPGLSQWEMPSDSTVEDLQFIQAGRYGAVSRGKLVQGGSSTAVVIKALRDSPTHLEAKDFLDRVDFHAKVCKHDNLVRMLFCQTQCFPMYLVLKASSPGNLLHFLWKLRKADAASTVQADQFSEKSVYSIAQQVAAGLDYLLSEHQLIHGDVAARNILISDRLAVQVSGLGLAFEAYQTGAVPRYRAAEVPLKWLAPERVLKRPMTARSDVWSFGILLYELITLGSAPYPELEPPDVFKKIQRFYRMKRPDNCGELLYDLMKQCWMWHPEDRPPFPGVIKHLDSHKHSADTKTLTAEASMDILRYSKLAGVLP